MIGRRSGSTLVEFAMAFPVLLLTLVGGTQIMLWSMAEGATHLAAQSGALYAVAAGVTPQQGAQYAALQLRRFSPGATVAVACQTSTADLDVCGRSSGGWVTLTVSGRLPSLFSFAPLPVDATVRLRQETFQP